MSAARSFPSAISTPPLDRKLPYACVRAGAPRRCTACTRPCCGAAAPARTCRERRDLLVDVEQDRLLPARVVRAVHEHLAGVRRAGEAVMLRVEAARGGVAALQALCRAGSSRALARTRAGAKSCVRFDGFLPAASMLSRACAIACGAAPQVVASRPQHWAGLCPALLEPACAPLRTRQVELERRYEHGGAARPSRTGALCAARAQRRCRPRGCAVPDRWRAKRVREPDRWEPAATAG